MIITTEDESRLVQEWLENPHFEPAIGLLREYLITALNYQAISVREQDPKKLNLLYKHLERSGPHLVWTGSLDGANRPTCRRNRKLVSVARLLYDARYSTKLPPYVRLYRKCEYQDSKGMYRCVEPTHFTIHTTEAALTSLAEQVVTNMTARISAGLEVPGAILGNVNGPLALKKQTANDTGRRMAAAILQHKYD